MTTIPDPTPPNHEAAANALITAMRDMVHAAIPGFKLATPERRRKIASTAALTDAYFEAVASACGAHEDLATAGPVTSGEIRNTVARTRVLKSIAEEFRILSRGVDDVVAEERYDVGTRALMVYNVARRRNAREERQILIPHVIAMQRHLRRGRNSKKVVQPPVPPPPAPSAPRAAALTADADPDPQNWKGE